MKFMLSGHGNEKVFAMGMLTAGFLSHMITDWIGDGNMRRYKVRFTTRIWPGDTVTCKGKVTRKYVEGGKNFIEAEVFCREPAWRKGDRRFFYC